MKFAWLTIGLFLAASTALAEPMRYALGYSQIEIIDGRPRTITIQTTAPSQEDVRIFWRTHGDGHCAEGVETSFEVLKPPRHGIVCFRIETAVVQVEFKGAASQSCVGASTLGRAVCFRPATAFIGEDSAQFQVRDGPNRVLRAVASATIAITPPLSPAASQTRAPSDAKEDGQAPGPMPRCPDLVN
jgi:hypothetical protein